MIEKHHLLFLYAIGLAIITLPTYAYEKGTHEEFSERAARQPNLNGYLQTIGLKSIEDPLTDINSTSSIVNWIRAGANDEDDTISLNFARYRNHFYDPLTGLGLNAAATGEPSPTWGLEDAQTFLTQSYSLKDAHQYFYDALTLINKDSREQWMARTFLHPGPCHSSDPGHGPAPAHPQ